MGQLTELNGHKVVTKIEEPLLELLRRMTAERQIFECMVLNPTKFTHEKTLKQQKMFQQKKEAFWETFWQFNPELRNIALNVTENGYVIEWSNEWHTQ